MGLEAWGGGTGWVADGAGGQWPPCTVRVLESALCPGTGPDHLGSSTCPADLDGRSDPTCSDFTTVPGHNLGSSTWPSSLAGCPDLTSASVLPGTADLATLLESLNLTTSLQYAWLLLTLDAGFTPWSVYARAREDDWFELPPSSSSS